MNKNLRKIIGTVLVVNLFTSISGIDVVGVNMEAYAASSEYGIDHIKFNNGLENNNITLYSDSNYKHKASFNEDTKTYYAKTNSNLINVTYKALKDYEVKVFKNDYDTSTAYDSGDKIVLGSGQNIIYVRVYEKGGFKADEAKSNVVKEYQVYITRDNSEKEDTEQDNIYLKDIDLSVGNLSFDENITTYDVAIEAAGNNEITIQAKPKDNSDTVQIENNTVDNAEDYKRKVRVKLGKNTFKIKVSNGDDLKRIYTVNIIRGDNVEEPSDVSNNENKKSAKINTDSNQSKNSSSIVQTNNLKNQWNTENGKCKYYDVSGNYLRNTWFTDKNSGKEYYFYDDGTMATNWIVYNNSWYYLGQDGAKNIGWKQISGNWYYFNSDGSMKTGWLKDADEKWYYIYSTGVMAKDTIIDGYTIGQDGVMK